MKFTVVGDMEDRDLFLERLPEGFDLVGLDAKLAGVALVDAYMEKMGFSLTLARVLSQARIQPGDLASMNERQIRAIQGVGQKRAFDILRLRTEERKEVKKFGVSGKLLKELKQIAKSRRISLLELLREMVRLYLVVTDHRTDALIIETEGKFIRLVL